MLLSKKSRARHQGATWFVSEGGSVSALLSLHVASVLKVSSWTMRLLGPRPSDLHGRPKGGRAADGKSRAFQLKSAPLNGPLISPSQDFHSLLNCQKFVTGHMAIPSGKYARKQRRAVHLAKN